jgi:hypothetical protein
MSGTSTALARLGLVAGAGAACAFTEQKMNVPGRKA